MKEPTVDIIQNNLNKTVSLDKFYDIVCARYVKGFYFKYKRYFVVYGLEINDLKQEILLMFWQVISNNEETKKISENSLGGYLYNASKWKLNNILSKAIAIYKYNSDTDVTDLNIALEESRPDAFRDSEKILHLFCDQHDVDISETINKICTEKESLATNEYFFKNKNSIDIGKSMEVSPQRVSALINSALLKLNYYFTQFIQRSKDE